MWHNHSNELFGAVLLKFALKTVSAVLRVPLSPKRIEPNTEPLQGQMAIYSFS